MHPVWCTPSMVANGLWMMIILSLVLLLHQRCVSPFQTYTYNILNGLTEAGGAGSLSSCITATSVLQGAAAQKPSNETKASEATTLVILHACC
ncbi:hypothetical protein COO60DRAFT_289772 [Scenedesmus sp. NREL 46B-D3]|nr:hypothetical protein COO60DRAFT_289772 [Scenedesmus sp. NREL 46B-D3]